MGTLYVVATPIGNLEDITLRALRILAEVSLIAAEDTRTTRKLLVHHGIKARLLSYNEHNMKERTPRILAELALGDVAIASDAGTPAVSDPGYELVVAAISAGIRVVPIPGASSLLAAVVASGLPPRRFTYLGFLPRRAAERRRLLISLASDPYTFVAFESPHRLRRTLEDILAVLGDRHVAVCREMTKFYEEIFRGTVREAIAHFNAPRGEFTLVVEGAAPDSPVASEEEAISLLRQLKAEGIRAKEAVRSVASKTGLPHRSVYALWVEMSRQANS